MYRTRHIASALLSSITIGYTCLYNCSTIFYVDYTIYSNSRLGLLKKYNFHPFHPSSASLLNKQYYLLHNRHTTHTVFRKFCGHFHNCSYGEPEIFDYIHKISTCFALRGSSKLLYFLDLFISLRNNEVVGHIMHQALFSIYNNSFLRDKICAVRKGSTHTCCP